jgi:hypothetical protein
MKDHNFVPFNYYEQWCNGSNMKIHVECADMFAPEGEVSEGFLGYGFSVGRNRIKIARFLFPTGCIQEVSVARGESALEAFQRWKKGNRDHLAWHREQCGDCEPEAEIACSQFQRYAALAGIRL